MGRSFNFIVAVVLLVPVSAQAQVTPGQWQMTYNVTSMEMPDAPPQVAQMMKSRMAGGAKTMTYCITPEQAKQGPQEMLKQSQGCRFTKYSMSGGRLSTEMTCAQQGGSMTVKANGSYTPTSFNVSSRAVMTGGMSMRIASTSSGKRVGPCTGGK
ncbi:MAG: DUF3617 domain-containing protein [Alphaproteobacteria bacterium]|nr:MAG: DUF3617 domain-containing protein [Alphaproteobacteria bacterium]